MGTVKYVEDYRTFAATAAGRQWQRIGVRRRAGVAVPLFALYSERSTGIGEIPDLTLLIDWSKAAGMSIIDLLPLNDMGFEFNSWLAQSGFALDPVYLCINHLIYVDLKPFKADIEKLRRDFPTGVPQVDYKVKQAKLGLLREIHKTLAARDPGVFREFLERNGYWLRDYALFRALKESFDEKPWEKWPVEFRSRASEALSLFEARNESRIKFYKWLQWQAAEQLKLVRRYGLERDIFLKGNLSLLAARDSAEVWTHQSDFRLDLASGKPPGLYHADGERWNAPPYHWEQLSQDGFGFIIEQFRYAQNFFDFCGIQHALAAFRTWLIPVQTPKSNAGRNGAYDPPDGAAWSERGREFFSALAGSTELLLCADDAGDVPPGAPEVLREIGIPGLEVQRWQRNWDSGCGFKAPEEYRKNAIAAITRHSLTPFAVWWEREAGTADEALVRRRLKEAGISFRSAAGKLFDLETSANSGRLRWSRALTDAASVLNILQIDEQKACPLLELFCRHACEKEKFWAYVGMSGPAEERSSGKLVWRTLEKINESASIMSIQRLEDWLSLEEGLFTAAVQTCGVPPGAEGWEHWTQRMPISLEELLRLEIVSLVKSINSGAARI